MASGPKRLAGLSQSGIASHKRIKIQKSDFPSDTRASPRREVR